MTPEVPVRTGSASRSLVVLGTLVSASVGPLAGCTDEEPLALQLARIAPEADPQCGAPADGRTLVITGLGDFPAADVTTVSRRIDTNGAFAIDSFPIGTRVVRVEVLGDAGAVRAMGKTAPLDLARLQNGATLPVFTAPPRGVCGTGPLIHPRLRPLLARVAAPLGAGAGDSERVGERVLIAGGLGGENGRTPVVPIERYDPTTGRSIVDQGAHYGGGAHGLVGATLTALLPRFGESSSAGLPHERPPTTALLAGGGVPAFQIYDGATGTWSSSFFLSPGRGHHAAVALDHHRVLLAGGCAPFDEDHECEPASADLSTSIVDVEFGEVIPGPRLLRARIRGTAIRESATSVLLVGGVDNLGVPVQEIERLFLDGRSGMVIPDNGAGGAVALASGSALYGFAPAGLAGVARLGVMPAMGRESAPALAPPWPLTEVTMTGLQDGRILVVGQRDDGAASGPIAALYEPNRQAMSTLDTTADSLPGADHGAIALADGTVFLVGGRPPDNPAGSPRASAWVVRPDLTGPYTSDVFVSFADPDLAQHLIPRDPAQHELVPAAGQVPAHALITAGNDGDALPAEWAILAGPVFSRAQVRVRVRSLSGGMALLFGFRAADSYLATVFNPGQPVTVYEVISGAPRSLSGCQAQVVSPAQLAPLASGSAVEIVLDFSSDSVTADLDGLEVLSCQGGSQWTEPAAPHGRVGVGVTGAAGAQLRVDLLTATR